jgi:N-acetylmuramoyl-L-alanine amidase
MLNAGTIPRRRDAAPKVAVAAGAAPLSRRSFRARAACFLLLGLAFSQAVAQTPGRDANHIRTVVLDAGHGGKDPGNLGTKRFKTTEKHVALNVAKLLGKYIHETCPT